MDMHQFLSSFLSSNELLSIRNSLSYQTFNHMTNTKFTFLNREFKVNLAEYFSLGLYTESYFEDPIFEQKFHITTEYICSVVAEFKKGYTPKYFIRLEMDNELTDSTTEEVLAFKSSVIKKVKLPEKEFFTTVEIYSDGIVNFNNSEVNTSFNDFFDLLLFAEMEKSLFSRGSIKKLETELVSFLKAVPQKLAP